MTGKNASSTPPSNLNILLPPSLRRLFAPAAFPRYIRVFLDWCRHRPAPPRDWPSHPLKHAKRDVALDKSYATNATRNARTAPDTSPCRTPDARRNNDNTAVDGAVADLAHEDRTQHARAPHHLPYAQDPPADDSAEPHGRPGAGAVLPTGTVSR